MSAVDGLRRHVRVNAAQAIHQGADRTDLIADLICALRGVGQPGRRERDDAEELMRLFEELDGDPPGP